MEPGKGRALSFADGGLRAPFAGDEAKPTPDDCRLSYPQIVLRGIRCS